MLDYYNFLEALWRIALAYPFSKEEQQQYHSVEQKFNWLILKLNNRYKDSIKEYEKYRNDKEQQMCYQPRTVVADDEEDMTDEDDD